MRSLIVERFFLSTILLGIILGIIASELFLLDLHFVFFLVFLFLGTLLLVFVLRMELQVRPLLIIIGLFFLSLIFGLARSRETQKEFALEKYSGETIIVIGDVKEEPEVRENYQAVIVRASGVITRESCEFADEKVIIRAPLFEQIYYGDTVEARGLVSVPTIFVTDTNRIFSYGEYLEKEGIGTILSFASIKIISTNGGNPIKRFLFKIKQTYLSTIERYIPDPESALLGGLTVGAKQSLGDDLEDEFRRVGIIHIVVLSGYNVIIIAEIIIRSLRMFRIGTRLFISSLAIMLFVILVGAGATVVRAGIMAVTALIVRATGREVLGFQLLFFAGIIMLLFNPLLLLHDPSFQLSFIATVGLMTFSVQLDYFFAWIRNKAVREIVTATTSTQIAVLPFIMFLIGKISLVALPVNLLVLPTVPAAMFLGFMTGITGMIPFVSVFLAPLFGILTFFVLSYELFVVHVFARIPFASLSLPPFSLVFVLLSYVLLAFVFWKYNRFVSRSRNKESFY